MKAIQVWDALEQYAPLPLQDGFDNAGLQVGLTVGQEVTGALLCLDVTEEVIDEAERMGCNLIVSHHPLLFHGLKSITGKNYVGRCVVKAIRKGIGIYAAHTNMDKAAGGVSSDMADKLGLQEREFLTPDGFGIVGSLQEPAGAEEFAGMVKEAFGVEAVRCSKLLEEKITRVAVCGGSGKSFIGDAMAKGAQVYITGDVTYHEFYTEKGFMIMDIGHYPSEYGIVDVFANILSKNFPTFAVSISKRNNNPIYYH